MTSQTSSVNIKIVETKTDYRCCDCDRLFRRESSLATHMCEPRRRRECRGERGVMIGYQAFLEFYKNLHGSSKLKTAEDFEKSPYYRAFVKFGRYCVDTRVVDPSSYMKWLLANNQKIDRWATDTEYTQYLVSWLCTEPVPQAVRRAMEWAQDWAEKNSAPARDCLRYGNVNTVCHAIASGRVSGWVLYNCASGQEFLAALQHQEIQMIWPYIDSDRWSRRFQEFPADQILAQSLLTDQGW